MSQYGFILDSDLLNEKSKIYEVFTSYFGNPELTKIENKNNYSLYAAKVDLMIKDNRYLIVVANKDNYPIGKIFKLKDIKWNNLQTRTSNKDYICNKFSYLPSREAPNNSRLYLESRKDNMSLYTSKDYKFGVCMLHTNNDTKFEYPNVGMIYGALETYQTIIQIEV
jgi:hypothetical protein